MTEKKPNCWNCKHAHVSRHADPCRPCQGMANWEPQSIDLNRSYVVPSAGVTKVTDTQVGGSHYQSPIQPVDFIVKNNIKWREANVIKYVFRHEKKNGLEDLKKARHYLDMLIEGYEFK